MSAGPAVSVVLPVYNAVAHIDAAIDSILRQTLTDIELIIVEDGSDDGTRERVAARAQQDARISMIALDRDPASIGPARARNIGNAAARAPYIAAMDADDIALPERLAATLCHLESAGLDACGGQIEVIGGSARPYWFPAARDAIIAEAVFRIPMMQATKIARADLMRAIPYQSPAIFEDYGWIVDALASGAKLGNAPQTVLHRRLWDGQNTEKRARDTVRDLRRFRFKHVMAHFAPVSARDFAILDRLANETPLADAGDLDRAGEWLVRLAATDDPKLTERLVWRWTEACNRAATLPTPVVREQIIDRIMAAARDAL
jgi:glycosyltransferase involved in cell wall biosynthesis